MVTPRVAASSPSRRDCYRTGLMALAASVLGPRLAAVAEPGDDPVGSSSDGPLTIDHIDRTTVMLPYRPVPERNMARELPHWRFMEVVEVRLRCGQVGFGETMLYYTWGATGDEDVKRAQGRNAATLMWDDSLGAGLQMALFDAVARAGGVPVHALLGPKVHERTPLSWWAIEMSPEDWASECQEARRQGYDAFKTKGRPWFDVRAQMKAVAAVVPESFKVDMDFNDTLLDAERAIPILKELEETYPQIGIYETPIPQPDVEGNAEITRQVRTPISLHYGRPEPITVIRKEMCDGFVVGHGASEVMQAGAVAAMAGMPFWLQLVGSDITAAFSLHFGGVLERATWPAVNCHQLFAERLLTRPIAVEAGTAAVPDGPGLGFDLDRDALRRFRVEKPPQRPDPPRLIETTWPDGAKMYIANDGRVNFMLTQGQRGTIPYFRDGAMTQLVPDDGSDRWRKLQESARERPVFEGR